MTDPIDAAPMPPPPQKDVDRDYLTHDITSALERAVLARIDDTASAMGCGRRAAAVVVLRELRAR